MFSTSRLRCADAAAARQAPPCPAEAWRATRRRTALACGRKGHTRSHNWPVITWLPWSAEAFARAATERKPVLLSITAAWCHACHEMDRTTYADPEVAALVRERFVAVRVDTDCRPDINERYNLGGWPTTAFLTADGEVITGGTFVAADLMAALLKRVASVSGALTADQADHADHTDRRATEYTNNTDLSELIESIFSTFDEEHGGFGIEPKFPHTAPLHLAMALFRETGDERWRAIVERTLDAMAGGGLWDAKDGGFYRYATSRDWQLPHREKLLETNADLLRIYAEAALVFGRQADRDRCAAIAGFITGQLRVEAGGYRGSDADGMLYMDGNAKAAGALLGAATVLDDSALAREALASFERVILLCYKPSAGLAHYSDGVARVRGLLGDQIYAAGALLDAHDVSALEPYKMMAEELTHVAVRQLWDEAGGGFFDRAGHDSDIGLLRTRRKPFVGNAEAASMLTRLERTSGDAAFRARAEGALAAASEQLAGQGPLAAHYVLGARQLAVRPR
jgi:uncharacterized protein YyaL (SSP411 family)